MPKLPTFANPALRECAITHSSYVNEHPGKEDNERLEFLGDAVLNFLSGEFLYKRYPEMSEGKLTPLRSALVDEKQLAKFATHLGVGNLMQLGRGALLDGGRQNPSLLSSALEAIIGAYYLDAGIDAVRKFVEPLFESVVNSIVVADSMISVHADVNFKSRFQEWALENVGRDPQRFNPQYLTIAESGPDHAKEFIVEVRVDGKVYGEGKGRSKKSAEQSAAEDALKKWV